MTYQEGHQLARPAPARSPAAASTRPSTTRSSSSRTSSGNPPSKTNAYCVAHHKPYSSLAADLAANSVASYIFITPNLCNDMHGAAGCPNSNTIQRRRRLAEGRAAAASSPTPTPTPASIFITWDEGSSTGKMPFLAVGPHVKANYTGAVTYTHSSIVKSVERILQLSTLSTVASANELSDLFVAGFYP